MGVCAGKNLQNKAWYPNIFYYCAQIWDKDTPNLFDFETEQIIKKEFILRERDQIVLFEQDLIALSPTDEIKNQMKIFDVRQENGQYIIKASSQNPEQSLWRVIRGSPNDPLFNQHSWSLKRGDTIKLGRIILSIEDYSHIGHKPIQQNSSLKNVEEGVKATDQSQIEDKQYQCRICLAESATIENPLLSPCNCSGSLKYCHLQCLKQWISPQAKMKTNGNTKIFIYKKLACELCQHSYKTNFKSATHEYNLLELTKPENPYLILRQILPNSKDHLIYLIDLIKKKSCEIGRVQDCDIRLNDISVSRQHAQLTLEEDQLILKDNNSKFGTLVQIKDTLNLHNINNKKTVLQTGKAIFTVEISKIHQLKHIGPPLIPGNAEIQKVVKQNEDDSESAKEQDSNEVIIYEAGDNQPQELCSINKGRKKHNVFVLQAHQQSDFINEDHQRNNLNYENNLNGQSNFNTNVMLRPSGLQEDMIE